MSPNTLERKYRRLTRLLPADWRAHNEDELVGTLLDAAHATEPGREAPTLGETADILRCAVVLRYRAAFSDSAVGLVALATAAAALALIIRLSAHDVSWEFLVTSLVVVLIPGTGVVYTVSSAIAGGLRRGLVASVGCTLGIVPHILAAMLGLSGVMQAGAAAFEVIRWFGVACLVVIGVSMIRDRQGLQFHEDPNAPAEPTRTVIRRGILLNLLNPKLTVFFFAFLPQFLDTPPSLLDPRLVGLGGVFMLLTLVVFAVYAWASAAVRDRVLRAPGVLRWMQRSFGVVLVGFAARLAVTDR